MFGKKKHMSGLSRRLLFYQCYVPGLFNLLAELRSQTVRTSVMDRPIHPPTKPG